MRIATTTYYTSTLQAIESQRAEVGKLNTELATGESLNKPSDNPTAFADAMRTGSQITAMGQYNQDNALTGANLSLASQVLGEVLTLTNRATALTEQAVNGATSQADRAALVKQAASLKAQLLGLANTRNGDGVYLFAGSRGEVAPFAQSPSGQVRYRGDGATQYTHVGQNQSAASMINGSVLENSRNGDGYAAVTATAANTGSGTLILAGITSAQQAMAFRESGSPYTVAFSDNPQGHLLYTVTRGATTITQGAYRDGMTINLSGVSFTAEGNPAAGDSFTVAPSQHHGMFNTLDDLISALKVPTGTPSSNAFDAQRMNGVLASLDQARTDLLSMQSTLGVAMRAVHNATNANATESNSDQATVGALTSADMPKVMTALNEHTASLAAAMTAFGKLSGLSLFKYI